MERDNYDTVANITITKDTKHDGFYTLRYNNDGEEWELFAPKQEILDELSEHMDNMEGE